MAITESNVGLLFQIAADASQATAELSRFQSLITNNLSSIASLATRAGASLTAGLTAPIAALGGIAAKSAKDIDQQVNALKAFTGGAENAEKRLAQLIATAQRTPGLTAGLAATLDAQLRVANVTEAVIDRILPAIGRLNAVSPLGDPKQFANNLTQIFTQGFERADLKELVGQSPLAGEVLKTLFSVDNPTNSEAIRASAQKLGITSTEAFFSAFAEAAARNPKLAAVTESIATQFDKLIDRVTISLRPLGLAIINAVTPLIEAVVPVIERVAQAFATLPQPVQATVVAAAAVIAAAGPLLLALAGIAQVVITLSEAWVVLQAALTAGGALAALPALLNPVGLAIAGVVAILAVAAVAWANYESAADKAAKVSADSIASQVKQVESLKILQLETGALAEGHGKLADVLAQLDPDTRAYIESIKDEKLAAQELNRILGEQIKLRQDNVAKDIASIGAAALDLQDKLKLATAELARLQKQSAELAASGGDAGAFKFNEVAGENDIRTAEELGRAINKTKTEVDGLSNGNAQLGATVNALFAANKQLTIDGFIAQQRALGTQEQAIQAAITAYRAFLKQQESAAGTLSGATNAVNQQKSAIDALKASIAAFDFKPLADKVQQSVNKIVASAKSAAEARAQLARERVADPTLDFAIKEQQRIQKAQEAINQALNPQKTGGGGGTSKRLTEIKADTDGALKLLKIQEQAAQRLAEAEITASRRGFEERKISIEQLERLTVEAEKKMLTAKEATFAEERRLIAESERTSLAVKGLTPKQRDTITDQTKLKLAEIAEREAAVRQRAEESIAKAQADTQRVRTQILESDIKNRAAIEENAARAEINRVKQAAADRIITEEAAARRIAEIEQSILEARRLRLVREGLLAGANSAELARVNGELAKLNQELALSQEDSQRRIAEARQRDLANLRAFVQERNKLVDSVRRLQVDELQRTAEALQRQAQENPSLRADAIQARLAAQTQAADLQHELNLRQIEDQNSLAQSLADTSAQYLEIEQLSNEQRLAEERRFQEERARIRAQAAADQAAINPASNTSIFGVSNEDASLFDAFGQSANAALSSVSANAANMRSILGNAFSAVVQGIGNMIQSMILLGNAGPAAFKKLAAGVIAGIASQAIVKAVFELAEGFAALARSLFGDPRAGAEAALHFKAAAIYGLIGAVAGGIGAAVSGGAAGGDAGGGSQGAGAFGGQREPKETQITRGDVTGKLGPDAERQDRGPLQVLFDQNATVMDKIRAAIEAHQQEVAKAGEAQREVNQTLVNRLSSMAPEDVLTVGVDRQPGVIAEGVKESLRRDGGFTREIASSLQLA